MKKLLALLLLSPLVAGELLEEDINLECDVILEQSGKEYSDTAFIKIDSRPSRYGEGGKVTELDKSKYEEGDFNLGELNILNGELKATGSMPCNIYDNEITCLEKLSDADKTVFVKSNMTINRISGYLYYYEELEAYGQLLTSRVTGQCEAITKKKF